MNTLIAYTYRDAANYKQHETIIVAGEVSEQELKDCCDPEVDLDRPHFIPSQVGLEDLQPRMEKFPTSLDHVWHELDSVEPTDNAPTIHTLTAEQLLANFQKAKGNWWVLPAMERLGLI